MIYLLDAIQLPVVCHLFTTRICDLELWIEKGHLSG